MAHDEDRDRLGVFFELLQSCKDKNSCLSHSTFGLAKHVDAEDTLRNTLLLNFAGVLKAAVGDGFHELWSEEEVLESCGMDAGEL